MNKKFFFGIIGCLAVAFQSCGNEDVTPPLSQNNQNEASPTMLNFTSKSDIRTLVEEGEANPRILSRAVSSKDGFISLLDTIDQHSPLLRELSAEEQAALIKEPTTYYEAFGYESILPNQNFARLLNYQGEIQLKDSVYRVTKYGMLVANNLYRDDIDIAHNKLNSDTSIVARLSECSSIPVTRNVYLSRISAETIVNQAQTGTRIATRTSASELPIWNFPRYTSQSHTAVGKLVGIFLGDRSVKHHDFMSKRRVKGSLYDYNYLVYQECGCFVAMSRKRGGFFRKINGWKSMNADELYINYRNVILELVYNMPNIHDYPKNPRVAFVDKESVPGFSSSNQEPVITIFGFDMTFESIKEMVAHGLKEGIGQLKNYVEVQRGIQLDKNIRVARIITKDKVYIAITDFDKSEYNIDSFRSVMSHSWMFYISNNIIKNPLSFASAKELYANLRQIPVKRIAHAEVLLAGRLGNNWGGMIITKK